MTTHVALTTSLVLATLQAPPSTEQGATPAVVTSVCEVLRRPGAFDNRLVQFRATVARNFEVFAIRDAAEHCGLIWLVYAGGGPAAMVSFGTNQAPSPRLTIALNRDSQFDRLTAALDARMYGRDRGLLCIDCHRYEVTATFTGRIDVSTGLGFGHLSGFPVQFVMESVTDIVTTDQAAGYDAKLYSTTPVRFPTGYIVGRVTGPTNEPIRGIYVQVMATNGKPIPGGDDSVSTDNDGAFEIAVPPGSYRVGANMVFPPSPEFPYPRTWARGTTSEKMAGRFKVADRQRVEATIRIPKKLTERKVRVHVTWPDGTPVSQANVWLTEKNNPFAVVGISVSHTNGDGAIELGRLAGSDYVLRATIHASRPNYDEFCASARPLPDVAPTPEPIEMVLTDRGDACKAVEHSLVTEPSK